jgi:hypothetical protein
MRERRADDWRVDLAQRRPLEAAVARALAAHPRLTLLHTSTAAVDRLDYQLLGPDDRLVELELKAKRQPYVGWGSLRPDVPEARLFVLDELALRRLLDAGRYAFLLVADQPESRWWVWSAFELIIASKVRTERRLATSGQMKGKLLLDMADAGAGVGQLTAALDGVAEAVERIDEHWSAITPWPWGRPLGA